MANVIVGKCTLEISGDFGKDRSGDLTIAVERNDDDDLEVLLSISFRDGVNYAYSSTTARRSSAEFYWDEDPEFCLKDLYEGLTAACQLLKAEIFQHAPNFMQSSIDWLGIHILFSLSMPKKLQGWGQLIILDYLEIPNAVILHCHYRVEDGLKFAEEIRELSIKAFGSHTG